MSMLALGTTRAVLCIGNFAFKIARNANGARGNCFEADLYQRCEQERRTLLCPPLWCSPTGAVLIMRRARPMTQSEFAMMKGILMLACDYRGSDDDGCPFEPSAKDWGWLDGHPVAVDYATPALDPLSTPPHARIC